MTTRPVPSPDQITVLVHGIWMKGVVMRVMGKMLEARGFRTHSVSYDFLQQTPAENARMVRLAVWEHDTSIWSGIVWVAS